MVDCADFLWVFVGLNQNLDQSTHDQLVICQNVLDAFQSRHDHRNQTEESMPQRLGIVGEQVNQKLVSLSFQLEYVVSYDLINQVFPQFRRNLKSVHSQTQQYFNH